MRKLKLYLDTSVISHLKADDTPDKMADTVLLWQQIVMEKYDIYISDVTMNEILKCKEPKQSFMLAKLSEIKYTLVPLSEGTDELSEKIIELGILKRKHIDDCSHIAAAIMSECDYIVSWNFKHMVNIKTVNGVRAVTNLLGYQSIDIIQPTMLIQGDDNDD